MTSPSLHCFVLWSLLFLSSSTARTSFQPKLTLVLPVSKDPSTHQYLTRLKQRTPLVSVSLAVDLGGQHLWTNCEKGYVSSTVRPGGCQTPYCKRAKASEICGNCAWVCSSSNINSTCWDFTVNSVTDIAIDGELASDVLSIQSLDGNTPGRDVSVPEFLFYCSPTLNLQGLASGVQGLAGLGRGPISLTSQFAAVFKIKRQFSMCLSSSTKRDGVVYFGDGPKMDLSSSLIYTPLIVNRAKQNIFYQHSSEYYIGVQSIKINEKIVPVNTTLLSMNKDGYFGTKISTANPYTILETSIYKAVINAFIKELSNVTWVAPVAPFGACFRSKDILVTRVGPVVPPIDLVLQNENVYWRIVGSNSMVRLSNKVMCLGVVDGGAVDWMTSIVIGGHQIEETFLEFDLKLSRLGFSSSSLLLKGTKCANFNFISN